MSLIEIGREGLKQGLDAQGKATQIANQRAAEYSKLKNERENAKRKDLGTGLGLAAEVGMKYAPALMAPTAAAGHIGATDAALNEAIPTASSMFGGAEAAKDGGLLAASGTGTLGASGTTAASNMLGSGLASAAPAAEIGAAAPAAVAATEGSIGGSLSAAAAAAAETAASVGASIASGASALMAML